MGAAARLVTVLAALAAQVSAQTLLMFWEEAARPRMTRAAAAAVARVKQERAAAGPDLKYLTKGAGSGGAQMWTELCRVMQQESLSGVVGPMQSEHAFVISPLLSWHQVPHVSPLASATELDDRSAYRYFRRTFPSTRAQAAALARLVDELQYNEVGVFYEGNAYAQSLMHSFVYEFAQSAGHVVHLQSMTDDPDSVTAVLSSIKRHHIQVIICLAYPEMLERVLKAALKEAEGYPRAFGAGHVWIASEDAQSLFDDGNYFTEHKKQLLAGLLYPQLSLRSSKTTSYLAAALDGDEESVLNIEESVFHSVYTLLDAIYTVAGTRNDGAVPKYTATTCIPPGSSASTGSRFVEGADILEVLDNTPTTPANADAYAALRTSDDRVYVTMNVNQYGRAMSIEAGDTIVWPGGSLKPVSADLLRNVQLNVILIIDPPYAMYTPDPATGEDVITGLLVDMFEGNTLYPGFQKSFGFDVNRTLYDGRHGDALIALAEANKIVVNPEVTPAGSKSTGPGTSNGSQQLDTVDVTRRIDMVVGALQLTADREETVDLTLPMFDTGAVLVVRKPQRAEKDAWKFTLPISGGVWAMFAVLVVCGAISFYITEGEYNDYLRVSIADSLTTSVLNAAEHVVTFVDVVNTAATSLWLSYTSILTVNDGAPVTLPGRIISTGIYISSTVLLATYTASLTTFLLNREMVYEVNSIKDFYPTAQGGTGTAFMRQLVVANDTIQAQWICRQCKCCPETVAQENSTDPNRPRFVASSSDAIALLEQSCDVRNVECPLASIEERLRADYLVKNRCSLAIHPDGKEKNEPTVAWFSIGFAMPVKSPFTGAFSSAILALKESGQLKSMETMWTAGPCRSDSNELKDNTTYLEDIAGVHILLGVMLALGVLARTARYVIRRGLDSKSSATPRTRKRKPVSRETLLLRELQELRGQVLELTESPQAPRAREGWKDGGVVVADSQPDEVLPGLCGEESSSV